MMLLINVTEQARINPLGALRLTLYMRGPPGRRRAGIYYARVKAGRDVFPVGTWAHAGWSGFMWLDRKKMMEVGEKNSRSPSSDHL